MDTILLISAIAVGFAMLIWGADRCIDGAANIASNLGVSPLLVGLLIVGFGTSAPEMLVSALAAFDGAAALGIGNALGSNITNIGLVLGITILIAPLCVHSTTLKREFPLLAGVMLLAFVLLADRHLSRADGLILIIGFFLTVAAMAWLALHSSRDDPLARELTEEYAQPTMTTGRASSLFVIGLVLLLVGSKTLIWGATGFAVQLGISELIIGLTVVALGTSLPELAASVIAALKNEHDIAVGNILGSNIFNLLAVLAMPGLILPSVVDKAVLWRDFPVMIVLTLLLFVFARYCLQGQLSRRVGVLLLTVYIGYSSLLVYQSISGTAL